MNTTAISKSKKPKEPLSYLKSGKAPLSGCVEVTSISGKEHVVGLIEKVKISKIESADLRQDVYFAFPKTFLKESKEIINKSIDQICLCSQAKACKLKAQDENENRECLHYFRGLCAAGQWETLKSGINERTFALLYGISRTHLKEVTDASMQEFIQKILEDPFLVEYVTNLGLEA